MELTVEDIIKIYFLTRTSLTKSRIINLAKYASSFSALINKIKRLRNPDLDRDWVLFDFEYKLNKTIYAQYKEIIKESDIFQGSYRHLCTNDLIYLIQIIGKSGYCRKCDTQFFPSIWWNHPLKNQLNYNEIKYGKNIEKYPIKLDEKYKLKLLTYSVDIRILEKAMSVIHSPYEIEKILKTQFYDKTFPPPPVKIHSKLMTLYNIWTIKPVKRLGIYPDSKYFFHNCKNNSERILFEEKNYYPWCPGCYTKFIPHWDHHTISKYHKLFTVKTYTSGSYETINNKNNMLTEKKIHKGSDEFFYLSILGLNDRSNIDEINNTFRKLSKIYHPDSGGNSEMFQRIVKAKEWLIKYYKHSIKIF